MLTWCQLIVECFLKHFTFPFFFIFFATFPACLHAFSASEVKVRTWFSSIWEFVLWCQLSCVWNKMPHTVMNNQLKMLAPRKPKYYAFTLHKGAWLSQNVISLMDWSHQHQLSCFKTGLWGRKGRYLHGTDTRGRETFSSQVFERTKELFSNGSGQMLERITLNLFF